MSHPSLIRQRSCRICFAFRMKGTTKPKQGVEIATNYGQGTPASEWPGSKAYVEGKGI